MRALIQRVNHCEVNINGSVFSKTGRGYLILLGITGEDTKAQCDCLSKKITELRIIEDENGKLNKSITDVNGEIMIVSQFTLYADCSHGRRPSFTKAAKGEYAKPLYESFIRNVEESGIKVGTGVFGADMKVTLENDGPVTIFMDTEDIM